MGSTLRWVIILAKNSNFLDNVIDLVLPNDSIALGQQILFRMALLGPHSKLGLRSRLSEDLTTPFRTFHCGSV